MNESGDRVTEEAGEEAYCSACNRSFPAETTVCPHDGARLVKLAAERDSMLGRVLDDRYEIRAALGKGGMGTVYRAMQLSVDREVAIKVIHPKLSNDRAVVKRFLREARLASRLSQPNIVNVYDFGQSDGVLYLVMELLRGHTLAAELRASGALAPKRVVRIASQLCDALEAAHAQGIVHRDLKPGNILILDEPPGRDLLKVLDFGLAKSLVVDSGSVVTNTDALLGTPLYMAPEQIEGKDSDQRADLYALGCIAYEMLSGRPPFVDTAVSAVLARHVGDTHKPLDPGIPAALRDLVDRLLAKSPAARPQSVVEVRRVLDEIRVGGQLASSTPLRTPAPVLDQRTTDSDPFAETHAAPSAPSQGTASPVATSAASVSPPSTSAPPSARSQAASAVASASSASASPAVASSAAPRRLGLYALLGACMVVSLVVTLAVLGRTGRPPAAAPPPKSDPQVAVPDAARVDPVEVVTPAPLDAGVTAIDAVAPAMRVDAGTRAKVRSDARPSSRDAGTTSDMPDIDFVPARPK
jgi:serine/threonine-protein kinase